MSVGGTDLAIPKPSHPIEPRWFSHKMNCAAVRYAVAVGIENSYIIWVNGPYPAGEWSDITIARLSLVHMLNNKEFYIADGGYRDGGQWSATPTGRHDYMDRQRAVVRSRYENINARIKQWAICNMIYRHDLEKHGYVFCTVANLTQLGIETDKPIWQLEYCEDNRDIS